MDSSDGQLDLHLPHGALMSIADKYSPQPPDGELHHPRYGMVFDAVRRAIQRVEVSSQHRVLEVLDQSSPQGFGGSLERLDQLLQQVAGVRLGSIDGYGGYGSGGAMPRPVESSRRSSTADYWDF